MNIKKKSQAQSLFIHMGFDFCPLCMFFHLLCALTAPALFTFLVAVRFCYCTFGDFRLSLSLYLHLCFCMLVSVFLFIVVSLFVSVSESLSFSFLTSYLLWIFSLQHLYWIYHEYCLYESCLKTKIITQM